MSIVLGNLTNRYFPIFLAGLGVVLVVFGILSLIFLPIALFIEGYPFLYRCLVSFSGIVIITAAYNIVITQRKFAARSNLLMKRINDKGATESSTLHYAELAALAKEIDALLDRTRAHNNERLESLASNRVLARELDSLFKLLDSINEGILLLDLNGNVTFANKAMELFLTVSPMEAQGKPLHKCISNTEVPELLAIQGDEAAVRGTRSIDFVAGEDSTYEHISVFQSYGIAVDEEPIGQVLCFRDNSKLKKVESVQSDFVDSVAHELRTPLTSIRAYVELLIDDEADQQTKYDFYNIIYEETHRLSLLIDNLLNSSMLDSGIAKLNVTPTRLKRLLEDSLDVIRPQCDKKGVTIVAELADRLPTLNIDKNLFGVAIMNILSNAVKYTPEKGTITLSTTSYEEKFHVEIRDTGVGVAEEEVSRIFEKFFRASSAGEAEGSGVGLSTALQIIRIHGGDIHVNSKVGKGSIFTIMLPRTIINNTIGE